MAVYNSGGVVSIEESPFTDLSIPARVTLHQNYPNPFNPGTTISYEIGRRKHLTLKVFDMSGREVTTLVDAIEPPGQKSVSWDASSLASGIYLYQLKAGSFVETRKMSVVR